MPENSILLQVGVKALLQNDRGEFLILHRSASKYPDVKNLWDIVGGRINPGSTLVDNLKREISEETKLELKSHPTLIAAQDILRSERHIVRLTYIAPISGEPILDEEHDQYRWVSREELINLEGLDDYLKQLVDKIGLS
jgi:8-oxo-dGTP diphosphatase